MKFFCVCFIGLFAAAFAVPVPEPAENLVRAKRLIDEKPKLDVTEPVVPPAQLKEPKKLQENEIPVENGENQERVKKDAYFEVPCGNTCTPEPAKEVVYVKQDPSKLSGPMELKAIPQKGARTFEPIYSFGPVSVHSAGNAYGSSYSHQPAKPYSSYAAPAGMQLHAVIPYMVHRQPLAHHSFANMHAIQSPLPAKPEVSYVFENPEPVYVETEEHGEAHAQHSSAAPVSLYCQSLKSKDLKAVAPVAGKSNATLSTEDLSVHEHIQRVNEIKEEISQLNQAAQRIVDQQEKLARMQREHMNYEPDYSLATPYQMRRPMPFMRPLRPRFRNHDDPNISSKEDEMRQFYPSPYETYYGYRSAYETGFPLAKAKTTGPDHHQDETEFFMKMLDMGKRMGMLSNEFKATVVPPAKEEEDPKQESLLTDLTYTETLNKEKTDEMDQPKSVDSLPEEPKTTKKDKRGLLPKKL